MGDASNPAGQEPEGSTGQQPDGGGAPQGQEPKPGKMTPEQMEAELSKTRQESAGYRKRAQEAEGKLKEHDDAKLSELEKAQHTASDHERTRLMAETELQNERVARHVERAASRVGFIDPEDAVLRIDRAALKLDDSGTPEPDSLEKALKALAAAKPYLVGARPSGSGDGGARRSSPSGTDMNSLIRESAGLPG